MKPSRPSKALSLLLILIGAALLIGAAMFWLDTLTFGKPAGLGEEIRNWLATLSGLITTFIGVMTSLKKDKSQVSADVKPKEDGSVIITIHLNSLLPPPPPEDFSKLRTKLGNEGENIQSLNEADATQYYLNQIASVYEEFSFPLGGLPSPLLLRDVYQSLPIIPSPGYEALIRGYQSGIKLSKNRIGDIDDLFISGKPIALVGDLGMGKTTAMQYLTWVYSRRPEDHLHWRYDEIVPFYLTAHRLADIWKKDVNHIAAISKAVAQPRGRTILDPVLVRGALQAALEHGNALILVDALDEYRALSDREHLDFASSIKNLWATSPYNIQGNRLLITSRPYRFSNIGFEEYAFDMLENLDLKRLAYHLGKAILSTLPNPAKDSSLEDYLDGLINEIASSRLQKFSAPFYVMLLILLFSREVSLNEGIKQLRSVKRLSDLYSHFFRQTVRWERTKPGTETLSVNEGAALLVMAQVAWQSFVPSQWREVIDPDLRISSQEQEDALEFWRRTSLLWWDEWRKKWLFRHDGFQVFGVAWMLQEAWNQNQRPAIRRLEDQTSELPEWDIVWDLFYGLIGSNDNKPNQKR